MKCVFKFSSTVINCTIAIAITLALVPTSALAVTENIDAEINDFQQQIEDSAKAYNEASENLEQLNTQIEENTDRIAEIEATLPEQQQKSDTAIRGLYILESSGTLFAGLIFGSTSLKDFINSAQNLSVIFDSINHEIESLNNLQDELSEKQSKLKSDYKIAEEQMKLAENTLKQAQQKREEAQQRAAEIAAAEAKKLEEERLAAEQEQASAAGGQSSSDEGETDASEDVGGNQPDDNIDWSVDKTTFVNQWSARIDAYLAGSPLAETGVHFASAAWDYGVDPRWSPAISFTESSQGLHCFKPHNAWGWGSISWGSWEEAIYAHVGGLSRGYGYTISIESAKKYCPPNWQHWYNTTSAQMSMI